jgi:uncharacterized protein (TIGR03437 family)
MCSILNLSIEAEFMTLSKVAFSIVYLSACGQLNAQCTFAVSPDHLNYKAAGETKSVKVVTSSTSCVVPGSGPVSDATWLHGVGGSQNNNVSTYGIKADANTGAARTATLTVAGQTIPVTQAAGTAPPSNASPTISASGIANGASFQNAGIAPGEILSIFGMNLGPNTPTPLQIGADHVTIPDVLAATQVFFDDDAAPILFTSSDQVSVIVPYTVSKKSIVNIRVEYGSTPSNKVSMPLSETSPALFSADGSGKGQGAFLNQDNSPNSPKNPAHPGQSLTLYGTGGGLSDPLLSVQELVPSTPPLPRLSLPVQVQIGGKAMTVTYAGGAPGLPPGLVQVNVTLSSDVMTGDSVPVILTVGSGASPATVTAAIH